MVLMVLNLDIIVLTYYDNERIFNNSVDSIHIAVNSAKEYFRLINFDIIGEEIKGRGKARDFGWRKGNSEYVLFVDVGVVLSADWLKNVYNAIQFGGDVWFGDDAEAGNSNSLIAKCSEIEYRDYFERLKLLGLYVPMNDINTSNCLFRRRILADINGFDRKLSVCEDSEIGYRIWSKGGQIIFVSNAKCTNIHRSQLLAKLKQSWQFGLGLSYIKMKHPQYSIHWNVYIFLPYSIIKRIFIWGLKHGIVGLFASIVYLSKRMTTLLGYLIGRTFKQRLRSILS